MTATARKKPAAKRPEPPVDAPAAIDPAEAWPIPRAAGERPLLFSHAQLRHAMDHAVLGAYGWPDLPTDCDFLLDYEINEESWGAKKKPYRYRWHQRGARRSPSPPAGTERGTGS